jgi:hypothetical protein
VVKATFQPEVGAPPNRRVNFNAIDPQRRGPKEPQLLGILYRLDARTLTGSSTPVAARSTRIRAISRSWPGPPSKDKASIVITSPHRAAGRRHGVVRIGVMDHLDNLAVAEGAEVADEVSRFSAQRPRPEDDHHLVSSVDDLDQPADAATGACPTHEAQRAS